MKITKELIIHRLKSLDVLVIIGKLNLFSNNGYLGACLNIRVLTFIGLAVPSSIADGLILVANDALVLDLVLLDTVDDIAFNVLAHVFVSFTDGSWWTCSLTPFLFNFVNSLLVVVVESATAFVAGFDVSAKASILAQSMLWVLQLRIMHV